MSAIIDSAHSAEIVSKMSAGKIRGIFLVNVGTLHLLVRFKRILFT